MPDVSCNSDLFMKKLVFIILLISALNSQSQVRIGLNIQPEISFANWEIYWFTYSFGVVSNINIYKWLSINAGIGFQSKQFDVAKLINTTDGTPLDLYLIRTIPVNIKPRINILPSGQKLQVYGIGGLIMNFCFYEKTTYSKNQIPTEIIKTISLYNALIALGAGIEYKIKKFSLFFEPSFNASIAYNCNYFHPYENTISFNFGCMYNISK